MTAYKQLAHVAFWFLVVTCPSAQTFQTYGLVGIGPSMAFVQGLDGNLYGTTFEGEEYNGSPGVFFNITQSGSISAITRFCGYNFGCFAGAHPHAGVILGLDGNFYGTTTDGGGGGYDGPLVFKTTSGGQVTYFYSFTPMDGNYPYAPLMQANSRDLYGTTLGGGANGGGTIFQVSQQGAFKVLYNFCSQPNCVDGSYISSGLIQASDGNFYGTAFNGGQYSVGTAFRISPGGRLTVLASFGGASYEPSGKLLQASDGMFYGTSGGNGLNGGTIFRMSPKGIITTIYTFCSRGGENCPDGSDPDSGVIEGTDGNLYGTTHYGGNPNCDVGGCGTVFSLARTGKLTTLHSFNGTDGKYPTGGLFQATGGKFWGTTFAGGQVGNGGTAFSLDVGLGPFVAFVHDSGGVGKSGAILGQGFTGTTSVSLNGVLLPFTVVSDTYIQATIPSGATTGFVTVSTPSGTLKSNVPFRVLPQLLSFDPPSGPPGTQVTITGVSLTQTLGVGFGDRIQSQFTVNSDTSVTATVPERAKAGKIGIETKGGVAISQGTFEVTE